MNTQKLNCTVQGISFQLQHNFWYVSGMLTLWLFIKIKQHVTMKVNANSRSYQDIIIIIILVSNIILHNEYYKKYAEFHVYFFLMFSISY